MTDTLFCMGVIDDNDRPRQHQPQPVRCLEAELVTPRRPQASCCVDCLVSPRLHGRTRCVTCDRARDRQTRLKAARHNYDASWRIYTRAVANGGVVKAHTNNVAIIERLIGEGRMRWGTAAELERMGLDPTENYAVIPRC
ncbi:MAG: hypothetical protein ACO3GP_02445 [Candidatus Limnocylindrus sp.]